MYPFNFITAIGLNQIMIFPVKDQSNLFRKYGSSRRIFNDVQGCTVLFLYFPDIHKTDSAAATVLVGGVPGLAEILKEPHIKGISAIGNLYGTTCPHYGKGKQKGCAPRYHQWQLWHFPANPPEGGKGLPRK